MHSGCIHINIIKQNNFDSSPRVPHYTRQANCHIRRGRNCHVPPVNTQAPASIQKLRYSSFPVHGPRLFNTLPASIRNKTGCTVEEFKRGLDKFLGTVPDETADTRLYCYEESWVKQSHSYGTVRDCPTRDIIGGAAWYVCRWRRPSMVTLGLDPETITSIHK